MHSRILHYYVGLVYAFALNNTPLHNSTGSVQLKCSISLFVNALFSWDYWLMHQNVVKAVFWFALSLHNQYIQDVKAIWVSHDKLHALAFIWCQFFNTWYCLLFLRKRCVPFVLIFEYILSIFIDFSFWSVGWKVIWQ